MTENNRGALIRSRTRRFLKEPPTRRAFRDERQSALEKVIEGVEYGGRCYSDTRSILNAFRSHYEKPVNGHPGIAAVPDISWFLQSFPKLSDDERTLVEAPITLDEVKAAISALQNHKSPGPDGLISEFYQKFSRVLARALHEVITMAYQLDALPPTHFTWVILF